MKKKNKHYFNNIEKFPKNYVSTMTVFPESERK